jgi:hypothetical protein
LNFGILKQDFLPHPQLFPQPLPQPLSQQLAGAQHVASAATPQAAGAQQLGSAATPQAAGAQQLGSTAGPHPLSQPAGAQQEASTGAQHDGSTLQPQPLLLLKQPNRPACALVAIEHTTRAANNLIAFISILLHIVLLRNQGIILNAHAAFLFSDESCIRSWVTPLMFSD